MTKKKILLLCGPSGAGKSYIENLLVRNEGTDEYIFKKLEQVTTRPRRDNNDTYTFISESEYKDIEDTLIAKTMIKNKDTIDYYGTIPKFISDDKVIHTAVVNKKGINDIVKYIGDNPELNIQFAIIMIDSTKPVERPNRDKTFIENERRFLMGVPDKYYINDPVNNSYITIHDIYEGLKETGLMEDIKTKGIKCPWIKCKYNTGKFLNRKGRCSCPNDVEFTAVEDLNSEDNNLIEGLLCDNFIWDNKKYLL